MGRIMTKSTDHRAMHGRCAEMESRLIRWMFFFWATWMISEAGLYYVVLRSK